jgi:hypothetical protein
VVYLADFRWRIFDFSGKDIPKIADVENSSLICKNRILVVKVPEDINKKQ